MNRLILPMLMAFAVADPCGGEEISQQRGPVRLEIRWGSAARKLALADVVDVALTVEGTSKLVVAAPLEMAPWLLLERSVPVREPIGAGRIRWRITYRFAPREPGELMLAFPPVKVGDGAAEETAAFDPVAFTVETHAGALRDVTGIEQSPPVPPPDWTWPIALAAAVTCASGMAIALLLWRMSRRAAAKTPADLALHEWRRLMAKRLPEKGQSERFVTLLTTIVRRYLERRGAIAARSRTTPEFADLLTRVSALSAADRQFLTQFFARAETVKFANVPMPPEECAQWAEAVRQFFAPHPPADFV